MKYIFLILIFFTFQKAILAQYSKKIEIEFKFGYGRGDKYDSRSMLFTKDMVMDEPLIFRLKLNKNEKRKIFKKLVEIKFWEYPERFDLLENNSRIKSTDSINSNKGVSIIKPLYIGHYSLKVITDSKIKKVIWNKLSNGTDSEINIEYVKLMELSKTIEDILYGKKEYQNSPKPRGGYL